MLYRRLICLFAILLLMAGCVTTETDLQTQRDLMEMKRRLADAERVLKEIQDDQAGGLRSRVETLSHNQADIQAGVDNLRVDMQSTQGRFDDQLRSTENLSQEISLIRDELSLQVADLEQRMSLLEAPGQGSVPASSAKATPATPKSASGTSTVTAIPANPTPKAETASALYDRALTMIREVKDFAGGRELMETFLKRYPKDPLAVNAAYWVGESYYAEKTYDQAILKFEDVIQQYGDHPKVASAMLKQGLAFDAMGDRANGKLLMKRVSEKFPLSAESKIAKDKLKEWGN